MKTQFALFSAAIAMIAALQATPALARFSDGAEAPHAHTATRADVANWSIGQSIVLRHAVELPLVAARDTRGALVKTARPMLFASGSEMSVLRKFSGADGEPLVELGLDFDGEADSEGQPLYPQITVNADLLLRGNPQPVTTTFSLIGEDTTLSPIGPDHAGEVDSDEIDVAIEIAGRGRVAVRKGKVPGHRRKGMTYCYRNVKNYLMNHCQFPLYLPGEAAISAVETLPKFGFQRISDGFDGFESMPVCAVCVLSGGTHICDDHKPCGDIVVKTIDNKGWLGWKPRATPYLDGRTPVGCFYRTPGTPVPVNPEVGSPPATSPTPQPVPTPGPTAGGDH